MVPWEMKNALGGGTPGFWAASEQVLKILQNQRDLQASGSTAKTSSA
jgi:hypothetical protein